MIATICIVTHEGRQGPWWSVDIVAGDDTMPLIMSAGTRDAADQVAHLWADHLGLEIKERDWSDPA